MEQQPYTSIEHPAHNGEWIQISDGKLSPQQREDLETRFKGYPDVDDILIAVETSSHHVAAHRQVHEQDNIGRLRLSPRERNAYFRRAGKGELAGEHILWFAPRAHRALDAPSEYKFENVTIDLFDKLQYGDWTCTHELDEYARSIPGQIRALHTSAHVEVVENMRKHNLFMPLFKGEQMSPEFDYALVRRRRHAANVDVPELRQVKIYKESLGLLILQHISPKMREKIQQSYATEQLARVSRKKDSAVSRMAGALFERAIREDKGKTKDIVPISASYLARVDR